MIRAFGGVSRAAALSAFATNMSALAVAGGLPVFLDFFLCLCDCGNTAVNNESNRKLTVNNNILLLLGSLSTGALVVGCGGGGDGEGGQTTPSTSAYPSAVVANSSNFYNKAVLLANLPDMPADPISFAAASYNSFKNASAKGNDAWSTKRLDLVRYYNDIRYGDNSTYYKEYTGTTPVFAELPSWVQGSYRIGVLNKQWQTNALDFYNFARAVGGMSFNYMSGYKVVSAQAAAWAPVGGSHSPSSTEAASKGIIGALWNAVSWGRGASNLMGGSVSTTMNYAPLTSFPSNGRLMSIWNESESGKVAGLGHRNSYLFYPGRDIGIGAVGNMYTWQAWGADPVYNDGQLLGGASQKAIRDTWQDGGAPGGGFSWPSNGYFPFFMWNGVNQAWSAKLPGASTTAPASGETITLKMEYFVHAQDGDLTQLSNPVNTLTLKSVVGNSAGGSGPDYQGADGIPNGATGSQYFGGGGYYFSANGANIPYLWRMPNDWYTAMATDFATATPKYHTVRFTFTSDGAGFKVKAPFYMNPVVGAPLVIQTTLFDIKKQAN